MTDQTRRMSLIEATINTTEDNTMPSTNKVMNVAVVISPIGGITFTLNDRTSVNTAIKEWRKKAGMEALDRHKEAGTTGGVIVIRMFADAFHAMAKHIG